jgi:hypothetical protein
MLVYQADQEVDQELEVSASYMLAEQEIPHHQVHHKEIQEDQCTR